MQDFFKKALAKIDKLTTHQIKTYFSDSLEMLNTFWSAFDSLPDGIIVGNLSHSTVALNKSLHLITPLTTHSSGHPTHKIWDYFADPDIASYCRGYLVDSHGDRQQRFTIGSAPNLKTIECTILPLVSDGAIIGNIIRVEDITMRVVNEMRLKHTEQLVSLTTLTANLAHEIKNPLAALSIYVQLIEKELKKPTTNRPTALQHITTINQEIERLTATVDSFLYSVRPMPIDPTPISIVQLIEQVLTLYAPELHHHSIALSFSYAQQVDEVCGDASYLKRAFGHIIKNSIQAMTDGGKITITAANGTDGVELQFIDDGVGIPQSIHNRIFEPYFTTKADGTGIGLTEVYKIIKVHHGDISYQSNSNRGTTCRVVLPYAHSITRQLTDVSSTATDKNIGQHTGERTDERTHKQIEEHTDRHTNQPRSEHANLHASEDRNQHTDRHTNKNPNKHPHKQANPHASEDTSQHTHRHANSRTNQRARKHATNPALSSRAPHNRR